MHRATTLFGRLWRLRIRAAKNMRVVHLFLASSRSSPMQIVHGRPAVRLQEEPERVKVALTAYLEERHIPFSDGTSTKCAACAIGFLHHCRHDMWASAPVHVAT